MIVLSASGLGKSYGTDVILEDISFHINQGDRVGIVGYNGAGKTTLLNMLSGELKPDSGSFFISKDITLGYLKQRDVLDSDRTVIEEVNDIFSEIHELEIKIDELTEEIANTPEQENNGKWERLNELQNSFERKGGYTYKSEISGILTSMAFTEDYYNQKTRSLSGGERTRLALACLLLKKPDILFLDEPTNHLDIGTLKWLEQYLKSYKGTIVLISHDRYFLDQTVNRIFEIEDGHLTSYEGNYTEFAIKKKALRSAELKAYNKQQTEIKKQEDLIRSYKERGTEKLAKRALSREKRLVHVERLEKPKGDRASIKIDFKENFKSGNDVLITENLTGGFTEFTERGSRHHVLFENVDMDIKRGEKICIVGFNGVGKTTLLKTLIGDIPKFSGYIKRGHNLEIGYYDQGQKLLDESNTVIDEIHNDHRLYTDGEIRNILGRFLFKGDMAFRNVSALSGGEKARLSILKLMMSGANLLIMDEPTNHLDIESKETFEDALMNYPGTVITVTHDRYFLNRIPDRIFELTPEGIREYLGKYDYYIQKKESLDSGKAYLKKLTERQNDSANRHDDTGKNKDEFNDGSVATSGSKEERVIKKQHEAEERKKKREGERLMELISASEDRMSEIEEEMARPENMTDHELLARLSDELEALRLQVEKAYEKWANLDI